MPEWKTVTREISCMGSKELEEQLISNGWSYFGSVHVYLDIDNHEVLIEEQLRQNLPVSDPYWCSIVLDKEGIMFSSQVQNNEYNDACLPYDCTEEQLFQCSLLYNISELDTKIIGNLKRMYNKIYETHWRFYDCDD